MRVNGIAPGPVDETEGMRRLAPTPEVRRAIADLLPLQRFATRDDIADMAMFLADGGQSLVGGGLLSSAVMR